MTDTIQQAKAYLALVGNTHSSRGAVEIIRSLLAELEEVTAALERLKK